MAEEVAATGASTAAKESFVRRLITEAVVVGAIGAVVGLATAGFTLVGKDHELKIKLVEIGISILRADPSKEDIAPARQWAIDVVEQNSGVRFSADDRSNLLHKPLNFSPDVYYGGGYDDGSFSPISRPASPAPTKP